MFSKKYGVYELYQDIPESLDYDGIEVSSLKQLADLKKLCPHCRDNLVLINSDAHQLEDIQEPIYTIDEDKLKRLWSQRICKKSL